MTDNKPRILLGFSGGMDSMTAVGRLRAEGYAVTALTIDTTGDEEMMRRARRRAESLGVEWHACDAREEFRREVIDYFIDEYCLGRTPAPCTRCNTSIKWRMLSRCADMMGIGKIATGHYFNIERHGGKLFAACAADRDKDQSYYLWGLSQDILERAVAPMGGVFKRDIRDNFADRSESMGICFLHGERYADYIRRSTDRFACGDIVDRNSGAAVGRHSGLPFYTIGQRRGDGIPAGRYVTGIDAVRNRIFVGMNDDLYCHTLRIAGCNIADRDELLSAEDITVRIRGIGRNPQRPVKVTVDEIYDYRIECGDPAWAPAAGQPLVFYRGGRVIGGGIIEAYG